MQQHDPGPLMQLFGELERLRKAWTSLGAHGEVSPAQFGTMMRIAYGCKLLACRMDEPWNEGITLSELARMERNSLPATSRRAERRPRLAQPLPFPEQLPQRAGLVLLHLFTSRMLTISNIN